MNVLYHNKDLIIVYNPPSQPESRTETSAQTLLEGAGEIRVLTTAVTQRTLEPGRAGAAVDEMRSSLLARSETVKGNFTQLFTIPQENAKEIYALSDRVAYIAPYPAAIRSYVEYRFKESQTKLPEETLVIVVDAEGPVAFITVLDQEVIEIYRAVRREETVAEFQRTMNYLAQSRMNRSFYLMATSPELAGELLNAASGLSGPDIIPEPCPALWALEALEVTPRFLLPEVEAKKELIYRRKKALTRLAAGALSAGAAGVVLAGLYVSFEQNQRALAFEREKIAALKQEISRQADKTFPALLLFSQPVWTEVIREVAFSLPEGSKITKMSITAGKNGIDTSTRTKSYAVSIIAVLEDRNPAAIARAQAFVRERLKETQYLRYLSVRAAAAPDGSVNLSLAGELRNV